mmetsp:Transcript_14351/g.33979  ORF Transcript_14351/g.33979 Transcript_14351/m.33979 type:complete len:232 (-) Transcript_14351:416-1111(-)
MQCLRGGHCILSGSATGRWFCRKAHARGTSGQSRKPESTQSHSTAALWRTSMSQGEQGFTNDRYPELRQLWEDGCDGNPGARLRAGQGIEGGRGMRQSFAPLSTSILGTWFAWRVDADSPSMRTHEFTSAVSGSIRAMHSVCQTFPHSSPSMYSISLTHLTRLPRQVIGLVPVTLWVCGSIVWRTSVLSVAYSTRPSVASPHPSVRPVWRSPTCFRVSGSKTSVRPVRHRS